MDGGIQPRLCSESWLTGVSSTRWRQGVLRAGEARCSVSEAMFGFRPGALSSPEHLVSPTLKRLVLICADDVLLSRFSGALPRHTIASSSLQYTHRLNVLYSSPSNSYSNHNDQRQLLQQCCCMQAQAARSAEQRRRTHGDKKTRS